MLFEYKTYWTDSHANKYFARMVINFFELRFYTQSLLFRV